MKLSDMAGNVNEVEEKAESAASAANRGKPRTPKVDVPCGDEQLALRIKKIKTDRAAKGSKKRGTVPPDATESPKN